MPRALALALVALLLSAALRHGSAQAQQCGCAPPVESPLPTPTPLPTPVIPLWPRVWLPWVGT